MAVSVRFGDLFACDYRRRAGFVFDHNGLPERVGDFCPTVRAVMSAAPPGALGTLIFNGFEGNDLRPRRPLAPEAQQQRLAERAARFGVARRRNVRKDMRRRGKAESAIVSPMSPVRYAGFGVAFTRRKGLLTALLVGHACGVFGLLGGAPCSAVAAFCRLGVRRTRRLCHRGAGRGFHAEGATRIRSETATEPRVVHARRAQTRIAGA